MTAACPVPRANSRAASKRRASNAATSRRPWRVLAMLQHGIVPDDDHQSISRESLVVHMNRKTIVRVLADAVTVAIRPTQDHFTAHLPRSVLDLERYNTTLTLT